MKGLPDMTPVKSSNLDAVGYRNSTLFLRFKSGALYTYDDVPEEVYKAALAAESPGNWFRSNVMGRYKHHQRDK